MESTDYLPDLEYSDDQIDVAMALGSEQPINKALVKDIKEKLDRSRAKVETERHEEIRRFRRMNRDEAMREDAPGSNQHVGVGKRLQTTLVKHVREAVYSTEDDFFAVDPDTPEDVQAAEVNEALLRHQISDQRYTSNQTKALGVVSCDGTGVFRTYHDRKEIMRRRMQEQMFSTEQGIVRMQEMVSTPEEKWSRPTQRLCDIFSIFPSHIEDLPVADGDANVLDAQDYLIETAGVRLSDLRGMEKRTVTEQVMSEFGPMLDVREVGLYRNLDQIKPKDARQLSRGGHEDTSESSSGNQNEEMIKGHLRIECHLHFSPADFLAQCDEYNESKFSPADMQAFMESWGITQAEMDQAGQWWVAEIVDDTLIRLEPESELPYDHVQWDERPGFFYGGSHYEKIEGTQNLLDVCATGLQDSLIQTIYAMFGVQSDAIDPSHGTPEEQLQYDPYGAIMLQDGRTVQEALQRVAPPESLPQSCIGGMDWCVNAMRLVTGADEPLDGTVDSGRRSATEASQKANSALTFVSFVAANWENSIVKPFLRRAIEMNQEIVQSAIQIPSVDPMGNRTFRNIDPAQLQGRVTARPKGSSDLASWMIQGQDITNKIASFGQQWFDMPMAIREVMRLSRARNYQRFVVSQDQVMQNVMIQQAMAQGLPGLPGQGQPMGQPGGQGQQVGAPVPVGQDMSMMQRSAA